MGAFLKYIIEMILCSGIFLAIYRILLYGTGNYRCLRIVILTCTVLSAAVPLMRIPLYPQEMAFLEIPLFRTEADGVNSDSNTQAARQRIPDSIRGNIADMETDSGTYARKDSETAVGNTSQSGNRASTYAVLAIYILTVTGLFAVIFLKIRKIMLLRKNSNITPAGNGYWLAENQNISTPFSFTRTIYMGKNIRPKEKELVICHESSHIRHRHPVEKLFMTVFGAVFWFNPFVWILGRQLEELQEMEADKDVIAAGHDIRLYRITIFKQLFGYYPEISCGLKNSLTLKRFKMMTNRQKTHLTAVRWTVSLVLIAGTTLMLGATVSTGKGMDTPGQETVSGIPMQNIPEGHIADINDGKHSGFTTEGPSAAPHDGHAVQAADTAENNVKSKLTIVISDDSTITVNGNILHGTTSVASASEGIDSECTVYIVSSPDVKMGTITDVKMSLRRLLKGNSVKMINIISDGNIKDSTIAMLPPLPEDAKNIEVINIHPGDLVSVKVKSDGSISMDDSHGPVEIADGDFRKVYDYAVEAVRKKHDIIFSLQNEKASRIYDCNMVRKQISEAFNTVREEYSRQTFGKDYDRLDETQQKQVRKEIPLRISEAEPVAGK